MIHIHTTSYDLNLNNLSLPGRVFKFPDKHFHRLNHHKLVPQFLDLHEAGEEVHIITFSGHLFWAIIEQGMNRGTLKRKDLVMHWHVSDGVDSISYMGPNLEVSAVYFSHWEGSQHERNVRNMLGFYKGDVVNTKTFE